MAKHSSAVAHTWMLHILERLGAPFLATLWPPLCWLISQSACHLYNCIICRALTFMPNTNTNNNMKGKKACRGPKRTMHVLPHSLHPSLTPYTHTHTHTCTYWLISLFDCNSKCSYVSLGYPFPHPPFFEGATT